MTSKSKIEWRYQRVVSRRLGLPYWIRQPHFNRAKQIEMHVALGIGHDDAASGEELVDGKTQIAFDLDATRGPQIDPNTQLELESIGAEIGQDHVGLRLFENIRMLLRCQEQQSLDLY